MQRPLYEPFTNKTGWVSMALKVEEKTKDVGTQTNSSGKTILIRIISPVNFESNTAKKEFINFLQKNNDLDENWISKFYFSQKCTDFMANMVKSTELSHTFNINSFYTESAMVIIITPFDERIWKDIPQILDKYEKSNIFIAYLDENDKKNIPDFVPQSALLDFCQAKKYFLLDKPKTLKNPLPKMALNSPKKREREEEGEIQEPIKKKTDLNISVPQYSSTFNKSPNNSFLKNWEKTGEFTFDQNTLKVKGTRAYSFRHAVYHTGPLRKFTVVFYDTITRTNSTSYQKITPYIFSRTTFLFIPSEYSFTSYCNSEYLRDLVMRHTDELYHLGKADTNTKQICIYRNFEMCHRYIFEKNDTSFVN